MNIWETDIPVMICVIAFTTVWTMIKTSVSLCIEHRVFDWTLMHCLILCECITFIDLNVTGLLPLFVLKKNIDFVLAIKYCIDFLIGNGLLFPYTKRKYYIKTQQRITQRLVSSFVHICYNGWGAILVNNFPYTSYIYSI